MSITGTAAHCPILAWKPGLVSLWPPRQDLDCSAGGQAWCMVKRSLLFHLEEGWYSNNEFEAISSLSFHCFVGQVKILTGSCTLSSERYLFCPGFVSVMSGKFLLIDHAKLKFTWVSKLLLIYIENPYIFKYQLIT